jgi:hypothetical protein
MRRAGSRGPKRRTCSVGGAARTAREHLQIGARSRRAAMRRAGEVSRLSRKRAPGSPEPVADASGASVARPRTPMHARSRRTSSDPIGASPTRCTGRPSAAPAATSRASLPSGPRTGMVTRRTRSPRSSSTRGARLRADEAMMERGRLAPWVQWWEVLRNQVRELEELDERDVLSRCSERPVEASRAGSPESRASRGDTTCSP